MTHIQEDLIYIVFSDIEFTDHFLIKIKVNNYTELKK